MTTQTAVYGAVRRKKAEDPVSGLLRLIEEENTDAAIYLQLSRILQDSHKEILHTMYQQELAHAACLGGIYTLITGSRPHVSTPPIQVESLEKMLRRCYGREMRRLAQYERKASDPEYGKIFAKLVLQEQEHCRIILQLLSTLPCRQEVG